MRADTIPARFLRHAQLRPNRPAHYVREGDGWKGTLWRDFVREVRRAARALISQGFQPGHTVAILGFNKPEWTAFDMAAMCAGGIPAGIYTTSSPSEVAYIIQHAESAFVLVENQAQWSKIAAERANLPGLKRVIFMRGAEVPNDPLALSWEAFLALGDTVPDEVVDERVGALKEEDAATFIYTSGTTGPPKAVMLSHGNLGWTAISSAERVGIRADDRLLSYLPLSHIAEQMFTVHVPAVIGNAMWYARSIEKLREDLIDVRPTALFGVPRVWEKFYEGITGRVAEAPPVRKALLRWARDVGLRANTLKMRGEQPTGALALQYRAAQRLVFSKLKTAIGLENTRLLVSGAAPITREVLDFFASVDMVIQEVYGQSEDSGPTSFNRDGGVRFGTVGQPIPDVDVRIAEDGEILIKGPNVFMGYFKDPKATAEALTDGWLHSGDLGAIDKDGFITITGRKKEIIITAGGKNIAPNNLEEALKSVPLVSEAVVIGDRRKYLVALLTLNAEAAQRFIGGAGGALHENPAILAELQKGVDKANEQVSRVEGIRKFKVLPRNLSMEAGELTPTLKLKRRVIAEHFANEIESLYAEEQPVAHSA